MRAHVYGVQRLDFTAADGNAIRGYTIYAGTPDDHVDGVRVDKIFVSDSKLEKDDRVLKPIVDAWMDFEYDKKGKVASVYSFERD